MPGLLAQLEHGSEIDSFEAAKSLIEAKGKNLIGSLSKVLRSAEHPYSREAAAYALTWLKNRKGATEALLLCAADTKEHDSIRGQAMEGLGYHLDAINRVTAPPKTKLRLEAEALMIQMLDSPSPVLRFWACFGLGYLRSRRAVSRLRRLVKEDTAVCPGWWYVAEEAEDALEFIAGRHGKDRTAVHLRNTEPSAPSAPGASVK